MLNEWKEFQDYTGVVNYTARNKQDTTYLGRFTFDTILDFEGLNHRLCQAGPVRLVQCAKQQKSHAPGGVAVRQ